MPVATLRLHGGLAAFAPRGRAEPGERPFEPGQTLKDAIEAAGVPHPEVDLVLVGGAPVPLGRPLHDGDLVDVYGLDRPPELASLPGLIPAPERPPRFVVDGHLGRLARYLRLLGFDTLYDRAAGDEELARSSAAERRILLTRDRGLLKRAIVVQGYLVREDDPRRQLADVARRFGLAMDAAPFSRCVRCNSPIEAVGRESVAERLAGEPRTLRYFEDFGRCTGCGAVYWQGSHYERMRRLILDTVGQPARGLLGSRRSDTLAGDSEGGEAT